MKHQIQKVMARFGWGRRMFPVAEQILILKKLSLYLSASLSLPESLLNIEEEMQKRSKRDTLSLWRGLVEEGKPLSFVFVFGSRSGVQSVSRMCDIAVAAAELGEQSGSLAETLAQASESMAKTRELKKKILSALAYPCLVLVGTCVLAGALMVFVFPKIIPLFESLNVTLPWSTRLLIATSKFVSSYWWFVGILFVVCGTVLVTLFRKWFAFRAYIQSVFIRLPVAGTCVRLMVLSDFFNTLEFLVRGGKQFSEAIHVGTKFLWHHEYKEYLNQMSQEIDAGRPGADFIQKKKTLFPPFVGGILRAGERSGTVESSLGHIARIARESLGDRLQILTAAVEPLLMILMALVIGFIAISIILPIYGITNYFQAS